MPSSKPSDRSLLSTTMPPSMPNHGWRNCTYNILLLMVFVGAASILGTSFLLPRLSSWHLFATPVANSAPQNLSVDYHVAAPFIFDSVQGLLKQWPNSYAPNGHSIVAGTLSPATVLYHAQHDPGPPPKPAFFAFDPEMSLGIHGGFGQSKLHVHVTTRTLNIIYFDGQSATLTPEGTLDSQMAVLQGKIPLYPTYDLVYDDDQRALDLCQLVTNLGIDGVVRMNAGFEVLVCDYSAAQMRELFVTNITVPGNLEEGNQSLPQDPNRQPPRGFGNVFSEQGSYEWLRSATWHYGGYGDGGPTERRVKLDLCRMVSFYDPALSSLVGSHHGGIVGNQSFQNGWGLRRGHRLLDINKADVDRVRLWLRAMTSSTSKSAGCSGIDWHALSTVIRAQHGTRAKEMAAAFEWKYDTQDEAKAIITKIHELSHAILAPYLEYQVSDLDSSATSKEQTISRCSSVYTAAIDPKKLARSEMLLYNSINIVMEKLCSWEWALFEWSEKRTTNYLGDQRKPTGLNVLHKEITNYSKLTADVLGWIGWDTWAQCDRQCALNELCAIPTWPVVYAPGLPQGGIYAGSHPKLTDKEMFEFWRPKCINRTDFDRGGGRGRDPIHQFPDVPPY